MIPTLLNGQWPLKLPEHRAARPQWSNPPYWEPERIGAMHDCIIPGDIVYDCGAEEGDMPALWALWGADVVAIEPNPRVWPNIRAIFDANDLQARMRGWFVGFVGDTLRDRPEWDTQFAGTGTWPECAYGDVIGDHGFLVIPERPDCPVTTIDALAELHSPPTVITIDVEGAELSVLRGAHRTLLENRPRVFVSVHQDMPWIDEKFPGDTGEKVAEYMHAHGYEGSDLALDHELHQEWRHPDGR